MTSATRASTPTEPGRDRIVLRDLLPAGGLLLAGLMALLWASLQGSGRDGQYLVIAAPWSDLGHTVDLIAAADGGIVEAGRFQNIAIAASGDADFARHARRAGAWLVFPSPRVAGCFGEPVELANDEH